MISDDGDKPLCINCFRKYNDQQQIYEYSNQEIQNRTNSDEDDESSNIAQMQQIIDDTENINTPEINFLSDPVNFP